MPGTIIPEMKQRVLEYLEPYKSSYVKDHLLFLNNTLLSRMVRKTMDQRGGESISEAELQDFLVTIKAGLDEHIAADYQ